MRALWFLAAVVPPGATAAAQTVPDAQQISFDRMARAPLDHENTFSYVATSAENRDYEGAIAALERVLAYNPHLPRAQFELGVLYFRLRSYEQAVIHFENALSDPELDPALARRIEGYLPEARKQLERSRFTGVIQFGYRYNSNVAGVPGSDFVRAFGMDVASIRPYSKQGDSSFFMQSEVGHVYDFENPRGDIWESHFVGYGALQLGVTGLSVGLMDFSTGPRLALEPSALPGWTIHPYASAGGSIIYDGRYMPSYGGGVSFGIPITPFFSIEPGFEVRRVEFGSFSGLPNQGPLATGVLWRGFASAGLEVSDWVSLAGKVFGGHNAADSVGVSSHHFGFESSMRIDFAAPYEEIGLSWSVVPFVRYLVVDFARADPSVDPFLARRDRQFRAGTQLNMPVTAALGISATAQYDLYQSNIRTYRASGATFLIGPTFRF